jgi:Trk K+ transport system NAD-binding subunit
LLGLVRRADIIRAYNLALSRRAKKQHYASRMRLRNIDGTEFADISLQSGDYAVGKSIQELALNLPEECILISIRRDNRVLIPHGNTIFQAGDQLTAFIRTKDTKRLHRCLQGRPE